MLKKRGYRTKRFESVSLRYAVENVAEGVSFFSLALSVLCFLFLPILPISCFLLLRALFLSPQLPGTDGTMVDGNC